MSERERERGREIEGIRGRETQRQTASEVVCTREDVCV